MTWLTWSLLAAFFAALTAILAKLGVEQIPSHLATAIRTTVVLIFTWIIAAATAQTASLPAIGRKTLLFLVLSGITAGLSWLCYFRALQLGPVSKVAPLDKLSLPLAILLAVIFLHERLTLREAAGICVIVLGVLLLVGPGK